MYSCWWIIIILDSNIRNIYNKLIKYHTLRDNNIKKEMYMYLNDICILLKEEYGLILPTQIILKYIFISFYILFNINNFRNKFYNCSTNLALKCIFTSKNGGILCYNDLLLLLDLLIMCDNNMIRFKEYIKFNSNITTIYIKALKSSDYRSVQRCLENVEKLMNLNKEDAIIMLEKCNTISHNFLLHRTLTVNGSGYSGGHSHCNCQNYNCLSYTFYTFTLTPEILKEILELKVL